MDPKFFEVPLHIILLYILITILIITLVIIINENIIKKYYNIDFFKVFRGKQNQNTKSKGNIKEHVEVLNKFSWWKNEYIETFKYIENNRFIFLIIKGPELSARSMFIQKIKDILIKYYSLNTINLSEDDYKGTSSTLLKLTDNDNLLKMISEKEKKEDELFNKENKNIEFDEFSTKKTNKKEDQLFKEVIFNQIIKNNEKNILLYVNRFNKASEGIQKIILQYHKEMYEKFLNTENKKIITIITTEEDIPLKLLDEFQIIDKKQIGIRSVDIDNEIETIIEILKYSDIEFNEIYDKNLLKNTLKGINNSNKIYIGELRNSVTNYINEKGTKDIIQYINYLKEKIDKSENINYVIKNEIRDIENLNEFNYWVAKFKNNNLLNIIDILEWRNKFLISRYEKFFDRCEYLLSLGKNKQKRINNGFENLIFNAILNIHEGELNHQKGRNLRYYYKNYIHKTNNTKEKHIQNNIEEYFLNARELYIKARGILEENNKSSNKENINNVFLSYTNNNIIICENEIELITKNIIKNQEKVSFSEILKIFPEKCKNEFINIYGLISLNKISESLRKQKSNENKIIIQELNYLNQNTTSKYIKGIIKENYVLYYIVNEKNILAENKFKDYIKYFVNNYNLYTHEEYEKINELYNRIKQMKYRLSKKSLNKLKNEIINLKELLNNHHLNLRINF